MSWHLVVAELPVPINELTWSTLAFHASWGLGLQILERQSAAAKIWPRKDDAILAAQKTCNTWNKWWGDCKNWWPNNGSDVTCDGGNNEFAPDSGI